MATLWERTPQRLPPAEPLPLRGDSSEGFQGFFSEFCSEKATSSPVFMRELPTASRSSLRRVLQQYLACPLVRAGARRFVRCGV